MNIIYVLFPAFTIESSDFTEGCTTSEKPGLGRVKKLQSGKVFIIIVKRVSQSTVSINTAPKM